MLKTNVVALSLALTFGISYLLCVAWGLVMPDSLHMHGFLELVLPGFTWLSWPMFLLGLVESILWGIYAGLVFGPIYNLVDRRWGLDTGAEAELKSRIGSSQ